MNIKILKANNGDSILITFKENNETTRNILIDGGTSQTYQYLDNKKKNVNGELKFIINKIEDLGQSIDLLIISHIDDDHIAGILKWIEKDEKSFKKLVKRVWFNSGKTIFSYFKKSDFENNLVKINIKVNEDTSFGQGETFENYIENLGIWEKELILAGHKYEIFGLIFFILSPNEYNLKKLLFNWKKFSPENFTSSKNDYLIPVKDLLINDDFNEDTDEHNGSSISFVLQYRENNIVFLADSHPKTNIDSLIKLGYSKDNPLKARLVKISHHGSKRNTNYDLLELIDTDNFIISSNGKRHNLPDKQCLSRIINAKSNANIFFNYGNLIENIFSQADMDEYLFKTFNEQNFSI